MTLSELREGVLEACKSFLAPYPAPIAEKKRTRIEEFVQRDGAMYRPILGRLEYAIAKIDPEATDDEIDRHLYEGYHELQVKLRDEGQQLLVAPVPTDTELEGFEERLNRFFEEISEVNRADLARYVCHRKAIIEFLQKQLTIQDGKYRQEDRVHNIIFPRGKTSDEVLFEDHNLWLVDERLVFHAFLRQATHQTAPNFGQFKQERARYTHLRQGFCIFGSTRCSFLFNHNRRVQETATKRLF